VTRTDRLGVRLNDVAEWEQVGKIAWIGIDAKTPRHGGADPREQTDEQTSAPGRHEPERSHQARKIVIYRPGGIRDRLKIASGDWRDCKVYQGVRIRLALARALNEEGSRSLHVIVALHVIAEQHIPIADVHPAADD